MGWWGWWSHHHEPEIYATQLQLHTLTSWHHLQGCEIRGPKRVPPEVTSWALWKCPQLGQLPRPSCWINVSYGFLIGHWRIYGWTWFPWPPNCFGRWHPNIEAIFRVKRSTCTGPVCDIIPQHLKMRKWLLETPGESKMKAVQRGSIRFNPFPHILSNDNPFTSRSKRLGIPDGDRDRPGRQKKTHEKDRALRWLRLRNVRRQSRYSWAAFEAYLI